MTLDLSPTPPARHAQRHACRPDPDAALRRWPDHLPLAMLRSVPARRAGDRARWTILAVPTRLERPGSLPELARLIEPDSPPPRARLRPVGSALDAPPHPPPFTAGWIGWLGYDLGRAIEPAAAGTTRPHNDRGWPLATLLRCPGAYCYDHLTGRWWVTGDGSLLPPLESLLAGDASDDPRDAPGFELGPLSSATGRHGYIEAASRCIELIHAGDAFQINLTHRLSGALTGSTRQLAARLLDASAPWYGAVIELPGARRDRRTILSLSPELFLAFDPRSRRVSTRPMKGTRPGTADPDELRMAPKDRAELSMIVDLMRNDLGRVAALGSVRVDQARAIERHATRDATVLQGVATVSATLRDGLGIADLLEAAFPGGSITGAPKIRAMQIIDELESHRRGPYCGSVGFVSDSGHAAFNIAIRTAAVTGTGPIDRPGQVDEGSLDYGVGAGIVADSDPTAEWRETLDKAGPVRAVTRITDQP